jgi:thermitase
MSTTAYRAAGDPRPATCIRGKSVIVCRCPPTVLILVLVLVGLAAAAGGAEFIPGQLLVKPTPRLAEADFAARLRTHGARQRQALRYLNVHVLTVSEQQAEAVLAVLQHDPGIEFAERDYVAQAAFVPNDPYVLSGDDWHLAKIQAPQAWDVTTGLPNIVVALLDSGINAQHPDLIGRVLPGYDFVSNRADTTDDFGHGTAIGGVVVAAGNNGLGVAGVAYGCSVLPVKVMDATGFASYSCIAQGIQYAVDRGVRIINISIAGDAPSSTLQSAINYAWSNNVVVVTAAGNNTGVEFQYPAACDNVVAVTATEPDDSLASFSNYGSFVRYSAPGDNIWTTQRDLSDPYGAWRGTSFASPIVAAAAALVLSVAPSMSNTQLIALLDQTVDDLGPAGYDTSFGYGRVNAYRAVTAAAAWLGAHRPPPGTAPIVNLTSPAGGTESYLGATVPLVATAVANAADAPVTNLWFFAGSLKLATCSGAPFTFNWQPAQAGTYALTAVATDSEGLSATSAPVTITVSSPQSTSSVPVLQFPVQSTSTPGATAASPSFGIKGNYAGLLADTNGVTPDSAGYFTLTATATAKFTGKLQLGNKRYGFHGHFDPAGDTAFSISRGALSPLTVKLQINPSNGTDQIAGQISDGTWTSRLYCDRNVFKARSNPAAQAGLRLFRLDRASDNAVADATGTSRINVAGVATIRGKLRDKRSFAMTSALSKNGDCPFYVSFNRGSEVIIGWLIFPAGQPSATSGLLLWLKTGNGGFASPLESSPVHH